MMRHTLHAWMVMAALAGSVACGQQAPPPTVVDEDRAPAEPMGGAASDAGAAAGAAMETANVKTALTMDGTVDASDINVDTHADTRVVVLRGSVPTSEQRDRAATIAEREAPGYRVDNQLTVRAR